MSQKVTKTILQQVYLIQCGRKHTAPIIVLFKLNIYIYNIFKSQAKIKYISLVNEHKWPKITYWKEKKIFKLAREAKPNSTLFTKKMQL